MPYSTTEKKAEWSRRYYAREKERVTEIKKAWVTRNPEKRKAQIALNNAVRDGKIKRQTCENCGEKAQAHHDDYSKPLEVRWLCPKHHREVHQ